MNEIILICFGVELFEDWVGVGDFVVDELDDALLEAFVDEMEFLFILIRIIQVSFIALKKLNFLYLPLLKPTVIDNEPKAN